MNSQSRSLFQSHPFHLVSPSPWPLNTSIALLNTALSAGLSFHLFYHKISTLIFSLTSVTYSMSLWFRDVISEGTYLGNHTSGVTVTYSHHSLIQGNRKAGLDGQIGTVILALIFTALQGVEYTVASFTISDGTYTSCFYFGTGFHGFHVIIGTIFLSVGFWRYLAYHLTENHHLGYESGILYWHFVDVVWLFLYISVYYWGS